MSPSPKSLKMSQITYLLLYLPQMQPVLPLFAVFGTTLILVDISSLLQQLFPLLSTILITPLIVFAVFTSLLFPHPQLLLSSLLQQPLLLLLLLIVSKLLVFPFAQLLLIVNKSPFQLFWQRLLMVNKSFSLLLLSQQRFLLQQLSSSRLKNLHIKQVINAVI